MPWIAGLGPGKIERMPAHPELVRGQFAKHHGARPYQPRHRCGIGRRYVVGQQAGVTGRTNSGRVEKVLVGDGDTVQTPPCLVAHDPRLGGACIGQRAFLGDEQEATHAGIDTFNAPQALPRELNR
jgi:hypothetical protein